MESAKIIKTQYLELINDLKNHYKFYRVITLDNGKAVCAHGRIGVMNAAVDVYSEQKGQDKYREKIDKGYLDTIERTTNSGHKEFNVNKAGFAFEDEPEYDVEKYNDIVKKITKLMDQIADAESEGIEVKKHREQVNNVYKRITRKKSADYDDIKLLYDISELYTID